MVTEPDCFGVIKALFARSPEPTHAEALEIYDALHEAWARLMRVRQVAPRTDYSAKLWRLMGMVGIKREPVTAHEGGRHVS